MAKEEKDDEIKVVEEQEPDETVSGEVDSSEEDDKPKKQVARKRGNDNQKRINELWMKRKEAEETANREAGRANAATMKNAEYEKITAAALEENINTKRELLTERLSRAEENGDVKKRAEITAELSKIEAQAAQIERYKLENQVRGTQQNQPQNAQKQQEEQVSGEDLYERLSPAGKKWMDDNRDWYDAGGDLHDPEKSADVTYYAQTLESEYRNGGRSAEIGTRAYFKKIDDYIKNNWSDDVREENGDEDERPAQKKSYAAPVGNRSVGHQTNGAPKTYKISQQEKELALSADVKDKNGKPLSDDAKIKRFVAIRESTPSSGPISMKTLKGA